MAFGIGGCNPGEIAAFSWQEGSAIARADSKFATRIAGELSTCGRERNRLRDLSGGVEAKNEEIGISISEQGHATFRAIPERGCVQNTIRTLIDKLPFDADRSNREISGTEGGSRQDEKTDLVLVRHANTCRENQLGGSFT